MSNDHYVTVAPAAGVTLGMCYCGLTLPCPFIEAQKQLGDAIVLERALGVLERTSRMPFRYTTSHWLGVKDTLREVAAMLRDEAENYEH